MLANATVAEWYKQHGRHPVYAKNKDLDLPEFDNPLTSALPDAPGYITSLNDQGKIYCWGTNGLGQLGRGAASVIEQPALVESKQHFTALAAGHAHTCAVTIDGAVACWGWNDFGQSGADGSSSWARTTSS